MSRLLQSITCMLFAGLLLVGCSEEKNEFAIPTTESGQKLFHEIGETFEFVGPESGLPFEIKVKDVWIEGFKEHEAYISEHVKKPDDDRAVIFISYTVTNKGDETYEFKDDRYYPNNDVLPNLIHPFNYILDIDLTYPEGGLVEDMEAVTDLTLEPGASMDITGSVLTHQRSAHEGAFVWDYDANIPQVIFTKSQSERRDQVGVYDIGDPIYVMDQDETFFNVTIDQIRNIQSDEDVKYITGEYDDSAFLVVDLTIENDGETDIVVPMAIPEIKVQGASSFTNTYFIKKGETKPIKDVHLNPGQEPTDGLIKAGKTLKGTVYYEVRNMLYGDEVLTLDDALLFYPYQGFADYPFYQQWVNYNLDEN